MGQGGWALGSLSPASFPSTLRLACCSPLSSASLLSLKCRAPLSWAGRGLSSHIFRAHAFLLSSACPTMLVRETDLDVSFKTVSLPQHLHSLVRFYFLSQSSFNLMLWNVFVSLLCLSAPSNWNFPQDQELHLTQICISSTQNCARHVVAIRCSSL